MEAVMENLVVTDRRSEILHGELTFPPQIMQLLDPDELQQSIIEQFFQCIWSDFLREQKTDTLTWYDKFANETLFNHTLTYLSKGGWITSTVESNYAFIEFNESKVLKWISKDELIEIKLNYKFNKYRMKVEKSKFFNKTKVVRTYKDTGLNRKGFMKAGNNKFKLDREYLLKYAPYIAENVKKGLGDSIKDVTYQDVIDELLGFYATVDREYTLGECINDSRGRAIFQCMKKIFNPISCKDARALMVCPSDGLTEEGMLVVFATISELLGYRGKNIEDKIRYGEKAYLDRTLPDLNEMIQSKEFDDLHTIIWLERIYDNLDNYDGTNWNVPIELDAMASMIQMVGVLTNNHEYMRKTNMLGGDFEDIWTAVPEVPRKHAKKAYTPPLYGSNQSIKSLWDKNKLEYTQIMLNVANKALKTGIFSTANNFKNNIINNVQPKVDMKVHIRNEKFDIHCNRFKWEETVHISYPIYTSSQGLIKRVARTLALNPDVNQFKRYFVTLLIHNLDSQVANKIAGEIDWILPNHDSFTSHPNNAVDIRRIYTEEMYSIYTDRHEILRNYYHSIGIMTEPKDVDVEQIGEFSPYCLK